MSEPDRISEMKLQLYLIIFPANISQLAHLITQVLIYTYKCP